MKKNSKGVKKQHCLEKQQGIFVCFVQPEIKINFIKRTMFQHHYYKDYNMPTCTREEMIKHDLIYGDLMEYFVNKYSEQLKQKGYKSERGDGVGFCFGSDNIPFLMFTVGGLK